MLHPRTFKVNEAWIAFKLNESPVSTEADGDFDVIALMDAASCFILGAGIVPVALPEMSRKEAKRLLKAGKSHGQQLPQMLYVPMNQAADIICAEAERNGIAIVRVPEKQLQVFIGEARQGFKEHIGGGSTP